MRSDVDVFGNPLQHTALLAAGTRGLGPELRAVLVRGRRRWAGAPGMAAFGNLHPSLPDSFTGPGEPEDSQREQLEGP